MTTKAPGTLSARGEGFDFVTCVFDAKAHVRGSRPSACTGYAAARYTLYIACARILRDFLPANVRTEQRETGGKE